MSKGSGTLGSQLGPWSHSLPVPSSTLRGRHQAPSAEWRVVMDLSVHTEDTGQMTDEIGRASCRERV